MGVDSTTSIQENYNKYAEYFQDSKTEYNSDMFYKLLLSEMTNQDPLEPTSNSEFVSQMASFTTLQNQTDALYYQTANYAGSLVGKTVTIAVSNGTGLDVSSGVVTSIDLSDGNNITATVNGNQYSLSSIMGVSSVVSATSSDSDGAYAVSLIGKTVTTKVTNSAGATILDSGVVTSIEAENGVFRAVVNGLGYDLSSVVKVENAAETTEKTTDSDKKETAAESAESDEELLDMFS